MKRGTYCGPLPELKGKTALLIDESPGLVKAQFDGNEDWRVAEEFKLKHPETGALLCLGWHLFPAIQFKDIQE